MLAATDFFSIGTTIGLVIAGVLAALKRWKDRRSNANGQSVDAKLDRIDRRLVNMDERDGRTEDRLRQIDRKLDRHITEHTRR